MLFHSSIENVKTNVFFGKSSSTDILLSDTSELSTYLELHIILINNNIKLFIKKK